MYLYTVVNYTHARRSITMYIFVARLSCAFLHTMKYSGRKFACIDLMCCRVSRDTPTRRYCNIVPPPHEWRRSKKLTILLSNDCGEGLTKKKIKKIITCSRRPVFDVADIIAFLAVVRPTVIINLFETLQMPTQLLL